MVYFPRIRRSYSFQLSDSRSDSRYRFGSSGAEQLINDMVRSVGEGQSLFRFRERVRALRTQRCNAALSYLIEIAPVQQSRLFAIWLRGRCGGYIGTGVLERYAFDDDERIRRAVAKALQNMSGWSILSKMARNDPSPRVRRLASPPLRQSFNDRLNRFSGDLSPIKISSSPASFYLSPDVRLRHPVLAKSAEAIRRILSHIKLLVNPDTAGH